MPDVVPVVLDVKTSLVVGRTFVVCFVVAVVVVHQRTDVLEDGAKRCRVVDALIVLRIVVVDRNVPRDVLRVGLVVDIRVCLVVMGVEMAFLSVLVLRIMYLLGVLVRLKVGVVVCAGSRAAIAARWSAGITPNCASDPPKHAIKAIKMKIIDDHLNHGDLRGFLPFSACCCSFCSRGFKFNIRNPSRHAFTAPVVHTKSAPWSFATPIKLIKLFRVPFSSECSRIDTRGERMVNNA